MVLVRILNSNGVLSFPLLHLLRLYTEEYYVNEMSAEGIPEIQRSNLVSCVIQVRVL